ncbi:YceI family protein [Pseudarthrobacter sp. N5]|uniref:YceI family protein n=1 Tax=Pseudarthrobacter sp. N5 TaxID=3418416 RepID=UPI003CF868D1
MSNEAEGSDLAGDYIFDVAHTRTGFVARYAMVTKIHGLFKEFEGRVHIDAAEPAKSSGQLGIVAESINTGVE